MKNLIKQIDWNKGNGLIPAIIQDANTGIVLMLGYMNKESFKKTLYTKRAWFYSRSKKKLWMKGETSGNILKVTSVKLDCDNDAILVKASPSGPICHKGYLSCFQEKNEENILSELFRLIKSRKKQRPENSYTSFLFEKGLNKICAKIKEESCELIKAAKNESRKNLINESADVLYHFIVLLVQKNIEFGEVLRELKRRRKKYRLGKR